MYALSLYIPVTCTQRELKIHRRYCSFSVSSLCVLKKLNQCSKFLTLLPIRSVL
ncbi:hypothetical protein GYMLUDRAFT_439616 [Collybiopsis luxurians FD-317 M1]|uniref:Uncharacterized protein n=1 Tax=Collybiopsis luxurians FD-317 M1 TaxID=944289 RepID=A0A0D0BYS5_9AGAR|nr:hypothetical protein GYMLUDRAFT_439616 [Collybiopsis luxurians FD-317 M1]